MRQEAERLVKNLDTLSHSRESESVSKLLIDTVGGGCRGERGEEMRGLSDEWKGDVEGVRGRRRVSIKMNDVHSAVRSAAGSRVASPSQRNKLTDVGTNTTQQKDSH